MGKTSCLLLFLVLPVLIVTGVDGECPYKECKCAQTHIMCDNLGLKTLPPLTTTQQTVNIYLTADSNLITTIPAGSLPPGLLQISLMNNPVATIDDAAFDQSTNTLETLSISYARFTRIPDAFLHLNALRYLNIYNTNITDWNIEAMEHIGPSVYSLDLENNGITTWPTWIRYFTRLTELSIIGCSFSSIPDDAFDNLAGSLYTLFLTNNSLTTVPKAVSKLIVLVELNLINTKISELTWLPSSGKLSSLVINNASISNADHLSNAFRPLAGSLAIVHLQKNQLTKIPNLSFMSKLGILDLTQNRISDPDSGSVPPGLGQIDLSSNMLPAVPRILLNSTSLAYLTLPWNSMTTLIGTDIPQSASEVDFGFNLITELTDASFPQNSSIYLMILSNNPITKISELAFKNLRHLTELEMQNTKLTRLPLALASLSKLTYLDISGDHNLVCTCTEASLRPLIIRLGTIQGDCGEISISFFFINLSPSCPTMRLDHP